LFTEAIGDRITVDIDDIKVDQKQEAGGIIMKVVHLNSAANLS